MFSKLEPRLKKWTMTICTVVVIVLFCSTMSYLCFSNFICSHLTFNKKSLHHNDHKYKGKRNEHHSSCYSPDEADNTGNNTSKHRKPIHDADTVALFVTPIALGYPPKRPYLNKCSALSDYPLSSEHKLRVFFAMIILSAFLIFIIFNKQLK